MNIGELASLAEIIGGLAVIVSLIYLAIQIRENALQTKLSSAIALNHLVNEAFDPIYNNDRNINAWTVGISDPTAFSEQDQSVFSLFMARLVFVLLTALMHDDHNILETEVARRCIGSLNSILNSPDGQYWLKEMGGDDQLSDGAREILANSTEAQDSLVHKSSSK